MKGQGGRVSQGVEGTTLGAKGQVSVGTQWQGGFSTRETGWVHILSARFLWVDGTAVLEWSAKQGRALDWGQGAFWPEGAQQT